MYRFSTREGHKRSRRVVPVVLLSLSLLFCTKLATAQSDCFWPPADMVAWWAFDDFFTTSDGTDATADLTSTVYYPATTDNTALFPRGLPTVVDGPDESAVCFDGYTYGRAWNDRELDFGTEDFSIDFWVKAAASTGQRHIIERLDYPKGWMVNINRPTNRIELGLANDWPWTTSSNTSNIRGPLIVADEWTHIAITVERDPFKVTFYKNGAESASWFVPGYSAPPTDWTFDNGNGNQGNVILGLNSVICLDEVELYHRAITSTEVQEIYQSGKCKAGVLPVVADVLNGVTKSTAQSNGNATVVVAVLTTRVDDGDARDFDALTIDPTTVRFGPSEAAESHSQLHQSDVDGDGDLDAVFHFKLSETGIGSSDQYGVLTAITDDGIPVSGPAALASPGID